jgi:hypothetical protein
VSRRRLWTRDRPSPCGVGTTSPTRAPRLRARCHHFASA